MQPLRIALLVYFIFCLEIVYAQDYRWQQRVQYTMDVRLDVKSHKLTGTQKLVYFNNSNDTLSKVYYHLYFNAFQPGSMMDVRSGNIADPDKRIGDRISKLTDKETGYQHIKSLKQGDKVTSYVTKGTILEVKLPDPILPRSSTTFMMEFEAQVPIQIRRSGRDNSEGIAYSMTQWYPKMAEYDFQGWHANQYVAREFFGVWGDYDVKITLDPAYVIGGTGQLQNPDEIGYGYETPGAKVKRPKGELTWHFIAKNVHDFAWAADPDYTHEKINVPGGPELHLFYQKNDKTKHWPQLLSIGARFFRFMNERFGEYPYETYSVIQGGDGGMEYPMCTLILGEGDLNGTAGTMIHEVAHSWFQMALATNESQYPWMDEGFTRFAEYEAKHVLFDLKDPFKGTYNAYVRYALSGKEEPLSQFSDFYTLNEAYSLSAYIKGCIVLNQLRYIIGEENFWTGIKKYYNTWKFHHPEPIDFIRVMEKVSGMQLKWYLNYWVSTTKHIDYGIKQVIEKNNTMSVTLERIGELPMPIDLMVTYKNGAKELYYIPLNETLGSKPVEDPSIPMQELDSWAWVNPTYTFRINGKVNEIETLEIDPSQRMADVNLEDNMLIISGPSDENPGQ